MLIAWSVDLYVFIFIYMYINEVIDRMTKSLCKCSLINLYYGDDDDDGDGRRKGEWC